MKKVIKIEGMSCMHCVQHVTSALQEIGLVSQVNLEKKEAIVEGETSDERIRDAIDEAGYEVVSITHEG